MVEVWRGEFVTDTRGSPHTHTHTHMHTHTPVPIVVSPSHPSTLSQLEPCPPGRASVTTLVMQGGRSELPDQQEDSQSGWTASWSLWHSVKGVGRRCPGMDWRDGGGKNKTVTSCCSFHVMTSLTTSQSTPQDYLYFVCGIVGYHPLPAFPHSTPSSLPALPPHPHPLLPSQLYITHLLSVVLLHLNQLLLQDILHF